MRAHQNFYTQRNLSPGDPLTGETSSLKNADQSLLNRGLRRSAKPSTGISREKYSKNFNSWNIRAFYGLTHRGSNEFTCLYINHPDRLKALAILLLKNSTEKFEDDFLE